MPQPITQWLTNERILVLAIGVLLGDAIAKLVAQFAENILSPILRKAMGDPKELKPYVRVFGVKLKWREFLIHLVEFFVVIIVVYFLSKRGSLYHPQGNN